MFSRYERSYAFSSVGLERWFLLYQTVNMPVYVCIYVEGLFSLRAEKVTSFLDTSLFLYASIFLIPSITGKMRYNVSFFSSAEFCRFQFRPFHLVVIPRLENLVCPTINTLMIGGERRDRYMLFLKGISVIRGARGVMVIVVGNGHGDASSSPGRVWLHFT